MFCRHVLLMVLCVTASAIGSAGCHGKEPQKPPASAPDAAPGAAAQPPPPPAPEAKVSFDLTPPPGYTPAKALPPLVAAWEARPQPNGFTPTLNLARRALPAGTPEQIYTTWRDELLGVLKKQYLEVKVLAERDLPAGARTAKLIILVVTLEIPGGKTPMPLFTYGAIFPEPDALWVLGAITGANLDVKTGNITPVGEPEILSALASFRLR